MGQNNTGAAETEAYEKANYLWINCGQWDEKADNFQAEATGEDCGNNHNLRMKISYCLIIVLGKAHETDNNPTNLNNFNTHHNTFNDDVVDAKTKFNQLNRDFGKHNPNRTPAAHKTNPR